MGANHDFVRVPAFGPEMPFRQTQIGKSVHAQEEHTAGAEHPENLPQHSGRVVHMVEDVVTNHQTSAPLLKGQEFPGCPDEAERATQGENFAEEFLVASWVDQRKRVNSDPDGDRWHKSKQAHTKSTDPDFQRRGRLSRNPISQEFSSGLVGIDDLLRG
jgi:hypothetical protein